MRTLVKAQCGTPAQNRFFFDDFFGKELFDFNPIAFSKTTPMVNVKETEKEFLVEVAAPGLQKEDFKVELEDGILSISAEKKAETTETGKQQKFNRKEFSYTSFKRSFTIDEETIDVDNIEAKYEDGILYLTLQKKEKVQPDKKVKTISIV